MPSYWRLMSRLCYCAAQQTPVVPKGPQKSNKNIILSKISIGNLLLISKIRKFCIFVIFWPVAPNSAQIFSLSWIRRFIHTTLYPLVASEKKSFSFAKIFILPVFWQFDNSFGLKEKFSLQMPIFYGRKTFWRGFDSAEGKSCSKRKYYT